MEVVLVLDDIPFVVYIDHFTFVRMELHFPLLLPFCKVVKFSLECDAVLGRLDSRIAYGVVSKQSYCEVQAILDVIYVEQEEAGT